MCLDIAAGLHSTHQVGPHPGKSEMFRIILKILGKNMRRTIGFQLCRVRQLAKTRPKNRWRCVRGFRCSQTLLSCEVPLTFVTGNKKSHGVTRLVLVEPGAMLDRQNPFELRSHWEEASGDEHSYNSQRRRKGLARQHQRLVNSEIQIQGA